MHCIACGGLFEGRACTCHGDLDDMTDAAVAELAARFDPLLAKQGDPFGTRRDRYRQRGPKLRRKVWLLAPSAVASQTLQEWRAGRKALIQRLTEWGALQRHLDVMAWQRVLSEVRAELPLWSAAEPLLAVLPAHTRDGIAKAWCERTQRLGQLAEPHQLPPLAVDDVAIRRTGDVERLELAGWEVRLPKLGWLAIQPHPHNRHQHEFPENCKLTGATLRYQWLNRVRNAMGKREGKRQWSLVLSFDRNIQEAMPGTRGRRWGEQAIESKRERILHLKYVEKLNVSDIARRVGCCRPTVYRVLADFQAEIFR